MRLKPFADVVMLDASKVNFTLNKVFVSAQEQKVKESIYAVKGLRREIVIF